MRLNIGERPRCQERALEPIDMVDEMQQSITWFDSLVDVLHSGRLQRWSKQERTLWYMEDEGRLGAG